MSDTSLIAAMLERHEGRRAVVYDDATGQPIVPGYLCKGHPTIGVGVNISVPLGDEEIDYLRDNRIIDCVMDLRSIFVAWDSFGDARQAALIDMRYQLGAAGFREFHHMISAAAVGDWEEAAQEGLNSAWAREVPARAKEVTDMLRTGEAPTWWSPVS